MMCHCSCCMSNCHACCVMLQSMLRQGPHPTFAGFSESLFFPRTRRPKDAKDKPFKCPHPGCTSSFYHNYNLNSHRKQKHDGRSPTADCAPFAGSSVSPRGSVTDDIQDAAAHDPTQPHCYVTPTECAEDVTSGVLMPEPGRDTAHIPPDEGSQEGYI